MKKIFGIMALSSLALAVSAEPEVCSFDPSAIGVTSTAAEFPAGTELGKTASVTCVSYNGSAGSDKIKSTSGENGTSDNYDYAISLDGAILSLTSGLQGSTNPTAPSADVWENYQPEQGWMLQFNVGEIATWGELYVSSKSTGNKKYWVVEESSTGERKFIPYWQVGDFQGDGYDYGLQFCTPYDMGVDESTWSLSRFDAANKSLQAFNNDGVAHGHTEASASKNGASLIFFDVLPNRKYYVFAQGSKITSSGFAYSDGALVKDIKCLRRDKSVTEGEYVTTSEFYLLKDGTIKAAIEANSSK